ncbi:MAG: NPCBM/NEW2 domain-containing protein [Phycisphaerales bacterium]|nr:NPCBM/NEW2 domain-containing protein [Phycisphaerales bacterium]
MRSAASVLTPDASLSARAKTWDQSRTATATALAFPLESVLVGAMSIVLMSFLYSGVGGAGVGEIGVPGNDSSYHIRMASLLPTHGFVAEFPWLRFAWFREAGSDFVSHHTGFHVLLYPFVAAAEALGADAMTGGRWATTAFFAVVLILINGLLRLGNVPLRWLWIALLLVLPEHFFFRHALVRAIAPSLMLQLAVVAALLARRPVTVALCAAAYNHLYLGAVMFSPVILLAYAAAHLTAPGEPRRTALRMCAAGVIGWIAGVLTYPYVAGMREFLWLQVFGTGLTPDIEVGVEWSAYGNVWDFATRMCGPLLAVWCAALVLRLRSGPPLSPSELTLLFLHLGFLLLTLKARRFIEYWPAYALLSAAWMAAPPIRAWLRLAESAQWTTLRNAGIGGAALLGLGAIAAFAWWATRPVRADVLSLGLALAALAAGAAVVQVLSRPEGRWLRRLPVAAAAVLAAAGTASAAVMTRANALRHARDELRCPYDLAAIRDMMGFIRAHSAAGDVIFTDDWDTFPVFFYHNTHNHYVVGLDPKFTHARRPDLWERYVRITRGQVPHESRIRRTAVDGSVSFDPIRVELADIRCHFGAKWVICDRDHRALAAALSRAPALAELVYPVTNYAESRDAPYLVFRIRGEDEPLPAVRQLTAQDIGDVAFLSELPPIHSEQGWGELRTDRSVGGGPLRVGGRTYLRGIGTHAPSRIEYHVPQGYDTFEAMVGVDASQGAAGTVVLRVEVDGVECFRSPLVRGGAEPLAVRVPVRGGSRLTLLSGATDDGDTSDHVNWAFARLTRSGETAVGDDHVERKGPE